MEEYWIFKTNMAKCKFCNKEYRDYIDKRSYKIHMIKKHNDIFKENVDWLFQYFELQNNRLKCNVCYLKYKIKVLFKLRKHSKKYHQNKSEIDRGKQYRRQDYWWIKYCTLENGKAQCRFCDSFYYITIDKRHYENHVAIDHNEIYNEIHEEKNWIWQCFALGNYKAICEFCKNPFSVHLRSNYIRRHLDANHKDKMEEKQDDESGQGIHGNEETNMKSLLESFINDVIQMYKK